MLRVYNVNQPVVIQVDACKSEVGAALFQNNKPIAMASKVSNKAESDNAIIEKELLAILCVCVCGGGGCRTYHGYGKPITIQTDHKPFASHVFTKLNVFGKRPVPMDKQI